MTKEQKIEWLRNASNDEVLEKLDISIRMMFEGNPETKKQGREDYKIVFAEYLERLGGKNNDDRKNNDDNHK